MIHCAASKEVKEFLLPQPVPDGPILTERSGKKEGQNDKQVLIISKPKQQDYLNIV